MKHLGDNACRQRWQRPSTWRQLSIAAFVLCLLPLGLGSAHATGVAAPTSGTQAGMTSGVTTPAGAGNALSFTNERQSYVSVPDSASLRLGNTFTIEVWFYQTGAKQTAYALINKETAGQPDGYDLDTYDPAGSGHRLRLCASAPGCVSANTVYTLDQWHHAAVVDAIGAVTLYLDGQPDGSGTIDPVSANALDLRIGAMTPGCSGACGNVQYFDGTIDEVRIWNVARTASEITAWMNRPLTGTEEGLVGYWRFDEGSGTTTADSSGHGNTGTLMNGPQWVASTAPIRGTTATSLAATLTSQPSIAWQPLAVGALPSLRAISCSSSTTCMVVGDNGTILTSTNAGLTWTKRSIGTTALLDALACPISKYCVTGGVYHIITTANGGAAWNDLRVPSQQAPISQVLDLACPTSKICIAVGVLNNAGGAIIRTTNEGTTWASQFPSTGPQLRAIACPTRSTCLAVGDSGTIVRTTDSGATWHIRASGTKNNLYDIACATSSACLAVSDVDNAGNWHDVVATADGGATWTTPPTQQGWLANIACPSSRLCLAIGEAGTSLNTVTPGGYVVGSVHESGNPDPYDLACPSSKLCLEVGAGSGYAGVIARAVGNW